MGLKEEACPHHTQTVAPVRSGIPPDNLSWVSHSSEEWGIHLFIITSWVSFCYRRTKAPISTFLFFPALLADATHIYLFTSVLLYLCETIALMQTDVCCLLLYSLYLEVHRNSSSRVIEWTVAKFWTEISTCQLDSGTFFLGVGG